MTALDKNIRQVQFLLGLNRWFRCLGFCVGIAAICWAVAVLADKLFELGIPRLAVGGGFAAGAMLISVIWARWLRQDALSAAAVLDKAAGLKERTSSALYCRTKSADDFAMAAVQDAETLSLRVSPRVHIPLAWPSSLSYGVASIVVALIVAWLPVSPIQAGQKSNSPRFDETIKRTEVQQFQNRLKELEERVKQNPSLTELKEKLKTLDLDVEKIRSPETLRREEIKKIDSFADSIRQQRNEKKERLTELKRVFRGMKQPNQAQKPIEELSKALAKGDFTAAQQAVKDLKEQLAKLNSKPDPKTRKKLQEQLENLSENLEKLASQEEEKERLQKELEQAGVDKELAKRALENLTKQDLQQIKEQMKKQGGGDQQTKEMSKKLQNQQMASKQCSNMANAMSKAAQAMKSASMADASSQLSEASDQLSTMEQLSQQVNELEALLADTQDMKNQSDGDPAQGMCQNCGGLGCKACGGKGTRPANSGMGRLGQGRGGRGQEEQTAIQFKKQRTKVHTTEGAVIGKMYIDGEQVKGDVSTEEVEVISAAEREATDAIERNKIPNLYHRSVKSYFSQLNREIKGAAKQPESSDDGDGT